MGMVAAVGRAEMRVLPQVAPGAPASIAGLTGR